MWLALFNLLFQLALSALRFAERRQQIEQAKVEVALELMRKVDAMVNDVDKIVAGVDHSPTSVVQDPANRDKPVSGSGTGDKESGV